VEASISASAPADLVRYAGQSASFTTTATGSGPFAYQWRKNGVDISAATNATCSIDSVSAADAGTYSVVVSGPCNTVIQSASLTVTECMPLTSSTLQLNRQTGLFEQKVHLTNSTDFNWDAVVVLVRDLRKGVQVYNASGTNVDGVPFVRYNQPLAPGQGADLTIEYYASDRLPITSTLCAQSVSDSAPAQAQPDGTPVKIDRTLRLADGTILIEFAAVPGQVYRIEYCEDLLNWKTVTPSVSNGANRIQWIDNGPPKTESLPNDRVLRFYRVVAVP